MRHVGAGVGRAVSAVSTPGEADAVQMLRTGLARAGLKTYCFVGEQVYSCFVSVLASHVHCLSFPVNPHSIAVPVVPDLNPR